MADSHAAHADDHEHIGHVVPYRYTVGTGLGLLVLTWLTVAVMGIDAGELNIVIALAIAVVKATLVCLFFMHLRWDRPFNALICVGSIAAVALFLALAMLDTYEYRANIIPGDSPGVVSAIEAVQAGSLPAAEE